MIGDRIKEARLALGYSAEQVAAFLGVSPATVYRYENGDISKLPSKFIKPLADFLCISPSYLMEWEEDSSDPLQHLHFTGLSSDEDQLIVGYRSLSPHGKVLLQDRCKELQVLYGKKTEDNSSKSV